MTLGERLKERRLELNLQQKEVAESCDLPCSTVCRLEKGTTKEPLFSVVVKIAGFLNIPLAELAELCNKE